MQINFIYFHFLNYTQGVSAKIFEPNILVIYLPTDFYEI
jgi:hypothetical protein